jgi:hypothetical protein
MAGSDDENPIVLSVSKSMFTPMFMFGFMFIAMWQKSQADGNPVFCLARRLLLFADRKRRTAASLGGRPQTGLCLTNSDKGNGGQRIAQLNSQTNGLLVCL